MQKQLAKAKEDLGLRDTVEPEPIPSHLVQSHGGVPLPSMDRSKYLARKMKEWRPGMKEPKAPRGWQEGISGPKPHMCELCSQEKAP